MPYNCKMRQKNAANFNKMRNKSIILCFSLAVILRDFLCHLKIKKIKEI